MALDLTKYNIGSLDRKEVMDSRQKGQRWPADIVGNHKCAVLGFRFVPPTKETKNFAFFQATIKILESTMPAAVGRQYPVSFCVNGDPMYQHITDANQAQFVAAAMGDSSDRADFKCDPARQELLDSDEKGELAGGECVIYHTTSTKTKNKAYIDGDGKPQAKSVTHVNHMFAAVR